MEKYLTKNNDKCHKDFFLNTVLLRIAPQREDELFGQMFFFSWHKRNGSIFRFLVYDPGWVSGKIPQVEIPKGRRTIGHKTTVKIPDGQNTRGLGNQIKNHVKYYYFLLR